MDTIVPEKRLFVALALHCGGRSSQRVHRKERPPEGRLMLREVELQEEGSDDAALLRPAGGVSSSSVPGTRTDARAASAFASHASPSDGTSHHPNSVASIMLGARRGWGISRLARIREALKTQPLLVQTVAGVAIGIAAGSVARAAEATPRAVELIGFPGEVFMRVLRALVLPLVSVSMVGGVVSLSNRSADRAGSAKRVAARLVGFYVVSTLAACALGLVVVAVVQPGVGVSIDGASCGRVKTHEADEDDGSSSGAASDPHRGALDSLLDTARAAVPANVVAAAAEGNILGVIAASLAFGAALSASGPEKAEPLIRIVASLNHVVEIMVGWAIGWMPPGVASLVAGRLAAACDPAATLAGLGKYVAAVLLGLGIHGGVVLPALFAAFTAGSRSGRRRSRRWWGARGGGGDVLGSNPGGGGGGGVGGLTAAGVVRGGAPAMVAAFATDSSSAALPVTRQCARAMGVPEAIADFSLPLGATVNMNGTALYEALTVLFIAQLHDVELGAAATIVVALTSTVAAVGAASIPSAGLVTMLIVLQAAGLAAYSGDVGVLLALDWFLDRCRTAVNVEGDLMAAVAVAKWEATEEEEGEGGGHGSPGSGGGSESGVEESSGGGGNGGAEGER